ncbi:S8 family serine peptidase [Pseudomonas sp. HS6]|uniref:S8 family serine peptidase n=1 Tax=Pseudomonas sp. HS6 TaxID=2850559 RepID=UPI0020199DB8|nr:S8 family serine peptidase [Pseudomonas sp. HS6]UQS16821.1 S8 family serine peptidase [Pseudomonas sp. HS6]
MPTVKGFTGAPSSLGQLILECPNSALVLGAVWNDVGNQVIPDARVTLTLGALMASAQTDLNGEVYFKLKDLPQNTVQFSLSLSHTATGTRTVYPEAGGLFDIKIGETHRQDMSIETPELSWSNETATGSVGKWELALDQGIVPMGVQLLLTRAGLRGRVRISIVQAKGAHGRQRNRSGQGTAGYLSRLRATLSANGVVQPLKFPYEYDHDPANPLTFHVIGLERGDETLKAEMLTGVGFTLPDEGMVDMLKVTVAPRPVASFRVYYANTDDDFTRADPEFATILALKRPGVDFSLLANTIKIAVLDNGISRDSVYLRDAVLDGRCFNNAGYLRAYDAYQVDMDDPHGCGVAGQAIFGSKALKLIDVRMTKGQFGGDPASVIGPAMVWLNQQPGIRILTTSVGFNWAHPDIVKQHDSKLLYCTTAGNNKASVSTSAKRLGYAPPSAILIARCKLDRESHERTPHSSTGTGSAVDLIVPGDYTVLHVPRQLKNSLNVIAENRFVIKVNQYEEEKKAEKAWDEAKSKWVLEQITTRGLVNNVLTRMEWGRQYGEVEPGKRPSVGTKPDAAKVLSTDDDLNRDDGVSFGVPVVANTAAKMLLINPGLSPAAIKRMLIDSSDIGDGMEALCKAQGVMNPLRAYFFAFDGGA